MKRAPVIPKTMTEYDLRLLKIFKSVVECGGFAAAETQLGVTRSTISVHMSNLETRMGLTLCRRGRGGFVLTEEGQQVYHGLLTLLDSINDFSLLVSGLGEELTGELVILCTDQLSGSYQQKFAEVIKELNEQAPNLHLVFDMESLANIEKSLLNDKAHIGLLPPYHQIDGLTYQNLTSEPIFLCCSKQHPLYNVVDSEISEALLEEQAAIHPGIEIDRQGLQQLQNLNLVAKAYQFDTRKIMILSGRYLGYLPQSQIQRELTQGELRLIKPDLLNYQFDLSMVSKNAAREKNKVDFARSCFESVFGH